MKKKWAERIGFALLSSAAVLVILFLGIIIWDIISKGVGVISWQFLTQAPREGMTEGGIFPAILGTFLVSLITVLFAVPLGMFAAIYLNEYALPGRTTRLIRLAIRNLSGVPSIVYGLFGLGVFVLMFHFGMSLLSASLTLACQALAMTVTTSREAILAVPREYREGSLAIGVTRWQTIRHIVLPQALPGIITGAVLAMSRAAGETAPILVVGAAFLLPGLPRSPFDQFMALPYHLYTVAAHVPGMPRSTVWGVALVLLVVVLSFNVIATIIRLRARQRRLNA